MNVQPNVALPVNQTPATDEYRKKEGNLIVGAFLGMGYYVGRSAAESAGNGVCLSEKAFVTDWVSGKKGLVWLKSVLLLVRCAACLPVVS